MATLKIDAHLERIAFRSGLRLDLERGDILVMIGPNNAGKSATLRDIRSVLRDRANGVVVEAVELAHDTPLSEIEDALRPLIRDNGQVQVGSISFPFGALAMWWGASNQALGPFFGDRIFSNLSTDVRLSDCQPAPTFDARTPHTAQHPFQYFYQDDRLEIRASDLFRRAFKMDLVIHRSASSSIPAYVGDRPKLRRGEDRISRSYLDRIEHLPRLEDQGDGMRSFSSVMGRVLAEERPILLIDEPEAFLHPPQARLLADIIAAEARDRQIFIATHSSDVLQGLLSSHADRVSVVRLSRSPLGGDAVLLNSSEVSALWRDPILRFSNVLDGLFHDAVVVTEADADCRFYEAIADASIAQANLPDIHYTYSGGKDRLPVVIRALRGLRVPVVTIADFDLLNSETPMSHIVNAHGGDWSLMKSEWQALKTSIEQGSGFVSASQFKSKMSNLLKKIPTTGAVDRTHLSEVKKLARNASPWDHVKQSGLAGVTSGEPTLAASRVLKSLAKIGIFVTPGGEMEGFCRSVGGHGPRWVEEVVKKDLAGDAELRPARDFVTGYVNYLNSALARK